MAKSSKAEDLYILIRDQILSGRWKSGDRLNDSDLAEEFEVSRLSVREALFRLTETGIIIKEYWKGYFIKDITEDIVSNIVEIRVALESCAIRNFVKERTDKDLSDLENVLNECEECLAEGDLLRYLTTDFAFHETIYTRQHNRYITSTLNNYMLTIHFVRYKSMGEEENFIEIAHNSIRWHRYILESLRNKDEEESVKRLVDHLTEHKHEAEKHLHKSSVN